MYRHLTPQERMDRIARLLLRAIALDERPSGVASDPDLPDPRSRASQSSQPTRHDARQ